MMSGQDEIARLAPEAEASALPVKVDIIRLDEVAAVEDRSLVEMLDVIVETAAFLDSASTASRLVVGDPGTKSELVPPARSNETRAAARA